MSGLSINKTYFHAYDHRQGWNNTIFLSFWNDFYREDESWKYVEFSSVIILSLMSLVINSWLTYAFCTKKGLRSNQNHYTIAVMIISILYLPFCVMIGSTRLTHGWKLGNVGCQLVTWATSNTAFIKMWLMALIGIDRYLKVARGYTIQYKYTVIFIVLSVMIPSITMAVIAGRNSFAQDIEYKGDNFTICTVTFEYHPVVRSSLAHLITTVVGFFVIPIIVIVFCYGRILTILCSSAKAMKKHNHAKGGTLRSNRKKSNLTKLLSFIVFVFVIMWMPFFATLGFLTIDHVYKIFQMSARILVGVLCIQIVNTIVEPFLYAFTSTHVRQELSKFCCKSKPDTVVINDTDITVSSSS